jgi:phenylalanyl-tRNA synthetase alpha subunit
MNAQYNAEIYGWVKKGNKNKSNKLNPRQMHLHLKADHKNFSAPSEQEISIVIGPMLEQLKEQSKKQSKKKQSKKKEQEEQDDPYTAKALEWCSDYLKQKVHQVGWEKMKPKTVVERMWNLLHINWPKKKFNKMEYNKLPSSQLGKRDTRL